MEYRHHNVANEILARDYDCQLKAIEYDAAGNLIKFDRDTSAGTQRLVLDYDYRNRLIEVYTTTDITAGEPVWQRTVSYYYDALNRRVEKDLDTGTDLLYIYDGWRCIEEREASGAAWTVAREHVYGAHYLDEIIATRESGSLTYYLQDSNYNVVAVAEDDGDVIERYWYEPYGSVTFADSAGVERTEAAALNKTLLFQGRRYDPETGFYYYRNRYYSPVLGRFLQRDPAGYQDGMSLYLFAGSSPLLRLDFLGLDDVPHWVEELNTRVGKAVSEVESEVLTTGWAPENPKYSGAVGKHIHDQLSQTLGGEARFLTDVYIDLDTNKYFNERVANSVQVDAIGLAPGYKKPQPGEVLDYTKIQIYELKTGKTGRLRKKQLNRLRKIADRDVIKVKSALRWDVRKQRVVKPGGSTVKFMRMMEVAGMAITAYTVFNYANYDAEFERVREKWERVQTMHEHAGCWTLDVKLEQIEALKMTSRYLSRFLPDDSIADVIEIGAVYDIIGKDTFED